MTPLEIWSVIGVILGAFLGYFGNYLIERRRERREKTNSIKVIECQEIVNTKILDKKTLGPIAGKMIIKVNEMGPQSEMIDVDSIYFARYRIRNLSDVPLENFSIKSLNTPKSVTFSLSEGENQYSPEWQRKFHALLQERKVSEQRGWDGYPVPYLNPFSSTGHELFLDLSSYESLNDVQISGGGVGVKFVFKKANSAK
jgi:hypothetical protein